MEFNLKIIVLVLLLVLVSGCNAIIGIPSDSEAQPWKIIYLLSFVSILMITSISVITLTVSRFKDKTFQLKLQNWLYYSMILISVVWLIGEMSLTPRTNIRIDLFITIPVIGIQFVTVFIGWLFTRGVKVTSNKPLKQDK
jgi:hypothetical protein